MRSKYGLEIAMSCSLLWIGCDGGSHVVDNPDGSEEEETDGTDSDTKEIPTTDDVSECIFEKTCAGVAANASASDCIADFDLPSNQAGFGPDNYSSYVGFYGYDDHTLGGKMTPERNNDTVGPAFKRRSCDSDPNNHVLHFQASGYTDWGAGIGVDWGGPDNASCDAEGALECYEVYLEKDKFVLAEAEKDPRCMGGDVAKKLDCLKRGKVIKETKDLSEYVGVGFWMLATKENLTSVIRVAFPIPETVRFYGGENGCSDDDGNDSTDCFNDFSTNVYIDSNDVGKWVFKKVYFDDLNWNEVWGLQLDELGIFMFPKTQSIGLKLQVDSPSDDFTYTDIYIDDFVFLRTK